MKGRNVFDVCVGVGLLSLAALKLSGAPELNGASAFVLPAAVGVVELALGAITLSRRYPRFSSYGTVLLGSAFCLWLMLGTYITGTGSPDCGCFGALRVSFLGHLGASIAVLACGVARLILLEDSPGGAARDLATPEGATPQTRV